MLLLKRNTVLERDSVILSPLRKGITYPEGIYKNALARTFSVIAQGVIRLP